MRLIIGIVGKIGSGKTTAADILVNRFEFTRLSFGKAVKDAACVVFGLEMEAFQTGKHLVDPYWGITRREMLQKLGTECVRQNFGQDFWVRRVGATMKKLPIDAPVVFDDVRFPEEAAFITNMGGSILRLTSPREFSSEEHAKGHESESYEIEASETYDNKHTTQALVSFMENYYYRTLAARGTR